DVPPALVYRRSSRGYPRKLLKPDPPAWREACDVDRYGCIRWHRRKLFVTSALAGEIIELDRIGETTWEIRFLNLIIAELDDRKIAPGIVMKRKSQSAEAYRMSVCQSVKDVTGQSCRCSDREADTGPEASLNTRQHVRVARKV